MVSEEEVRRIALGLPGAYEQATYGGCPSWRTTPRQFAWIRDEPRALVVWVEAAEVKNSLAATEPETFFTTPHYDGLPIVLVRLDQVDLAEAAELVTESWRLRAPKSLVKEWDATHG